ncbi:MAG: hypothetical protein JNN13_18060, partial [Planctomycetes bacterium]|nr:hypothetical protein [Planctomycetota bacterium]
GDLPAFADLLVRLHGDPAAGRAMVMRARRFTQEHAWENEFAGYRELLARLTGRSLAKAAG